MIYIDSSDNIGEDSLDDSVWIMNTFRIEKNLNNLLSAELVRDILDSFLWNPNVLPTTSNEKVLRTVYLPKIQHNYLIKLSKKLQISKHLILEMAIKQKFGI